MASKTTDATNTEQVTDLVPGDELPGNTDAAENNLSADVSGAASTPDDPDKGSAPAPIADTAAEVGKRSKKATLKFPYDIEIVNDTGVPYVVTGTYVPAGSTSKKNVMDEDEIIRAETDCEHITALLDHYKDAEVQPIRVVRPA